LAPPDLLLQILYEFVLEMILVHIIGCDNKEIINPYSDNIEFIIVTLNKDTIFGDQFGKSN